MRVCQPLVNAVLGLTTEHTLDLVRYLLKFGAQVYIQPKLLTLPVRPDPLASPLGAKLSNPAASR
jgi:hypothetical protein